MVYRGSIENLHNRPGVGERLSRAIAENSPSIAAQYAQNKKLKELTGHDLTDLSPDMQSHFVKNIMSQKEESPNNLAGASDALDRMEALIDAEGVGFLASLNPSGKSRENRGEFETLQASILPIFKQLFPRGFTDREFKVILDKYVPQVNETAEKKRGKIRGLRRAIQTGNLSQDISDENAVDGDQKAIKFDPKNKEHVAKLRQLDKKFKGDRRKVNEVLSREFTL